MTTGQVLYRKWRPRRFADVVGQDVITQTLRQAVAQGRVAHAYLLCGPRGTGKTSTARILAKAQNCLGLQGGPAAEDGAQGEPDDTCAFCQAVNEGRALDMIEMDAASHRGIDDVRSLRERVFGSGPAEGRAKVYIIDEAHMLTEPAFNALLKTLEEPAPWAYFILCTTEAHKIPATIASRCQRFDFRRIASRDVMARLETICREEGIEWEPEALHTIARVTWGSLRDACNVLEQTVTSYGPRVTMVDVQELLGLSRDGSALELVDYALAGDVAQGLGVINRATVAGADLRAFHRDVVDYLRALLLLRTGAEVALEYPAEILEQLHAIASRTSWERTLGAVKLFGEVNLRAGEGPSSLPLELALVECASATDGGRAQEAPSNGAPTATITRETAATPKVQPSEIPVPPPAPEPNSPSKEKTVPQPEPTVAVSPVDSHAATVAAEPLSREASPTADENSIHLSVEQWEGLCRTLKRFRGRKFVLGSLLLDCRDRYTQGDTLVLLFRNRANRDRLQEELEHPPSQQALQEAVQAALGRDYRLKLEAAENQVVQGKPQGHLVQAAQAMGAKIIGVKEEAP